MQFDADGNMTRGILGGELADFVFDSRNRLTQAGNATYRYDAENQRIGINQTQFVVNSQPALSQVLVKESNGVKTFYVYGLGLIGEETNGQYRTYHFDYRGSTVALTDEMGQVIQRFQYAPYGELVSGDSSQTPFLFNGLYGVMTDDNGLYYMRARYYSPKIKRFINQDILLGNVTQGQTLNRFAYVTGNPISFVDPFGLEKFCGQCAPGAYDCLLYNYNLCESSIVAVPENQVNYCGRCAIGAYDCLLYNYNLCEPPPGKIEEIYNYARENRIWGHQTYPSEQNSNMRHCVVSCLFSSTYGAGVARTFGVLNELQGFIMHDLRLLPSRIEGNSAWAFQLQDLLSNENGFSCAKINQYTEEGTEQPVCTIYCGRYSDN